MNTHLSRRCHGQPICEASAGDRYIGPDEPYLFGRMQVGGPYPKHRRYRSQHDTNWPDWYADHIVMEQAGEPLPT